MAGAKPEIFISYRRNSAQVVDHFHEKLCGRVEAKFVFLDRADIAPGEKFPDRIRTTIQNASIVLVFIGNDWISQQDPRTFRRRLELEEDWVRQEIEIALQGKGTVIPVLIEGARMPTSEQLPGSLAALASLNAHNLSREHFSHDSEKLIELTVRTLAGRAEESLKEGGSPYPKPPEHGYRPVLPTERDLAAMLKELPFWKTVESEVVDDPRFGAGYKRIEIVREFRFESFIDAIEFMRMAADQIDSFNHHPRWQNVFRTVTVYYSTWDVGHRPSDRDLKSAQMLEKIYQRFLAGKKSVPTR